MNRKQYLEYIDHFNHKRYDKLKSYFTDDVTVEYFDDAYGPYAPARTLHGPEEFARNYMELHAHTRELLELGAFWSEGDQLFAELYTEFHTFKDVKGPGRPRKKGDIVIMTNWVLYDFDKSGRMKRIRIAHFRNSDPKTARYSADA
jgi:hypothetical protein